MISIFDMSNRLVEHGINVTVSREVGDVWKIKAQKGGDSGIWTVMPDDVELMYLSHDTVRLLTINAIINYFDEKEREKEYEMKNNEQKFTRDDLKLGHIIKLRNGKCYSIQMVGKETLIATDGDRDWEYLSRGWDNQLYSTCRGGKTYPAITYDKTKDIVEVYGYVQGTDYYARESGCISPDHRPLLWSRQEAKKMTVEEIEKVLGYKVEIVSD